MPGLHDRYHADDDGTLWRLASYDLTTNGPIRATLRVDHDGKNLREGWSPACLNRDDGVRAADASIDTTPPDGPHLDDLTPHPARRSGRSSCVVPNASIADDLLVTTSW